MAKGKVLLVEDNPLTRKLVRAALEREVASLLEAPDARTAMQLLDSHQPDLVLQDLILPDLSGFELLQLMRAHPSANAVPILAFTGLLSKDDEARATAAGFDGFITKPIEPSRLRHLVRGHLPSEKLRIAPFGQGKRLLVVDDDPLQLKLARYRLAKLGFAVEAASNGVDALDAARRLRPDVIVTDALMPKLDGFGLTMAVREDANLSQVPVVLVTSSYLENADRELARRTGANAFVVRTADLHDVIVALEKIFVGTPTRVPPNIVTEPQTSTETARALRVLHQLERQVAVNAGLMQRCSTLAAELSVLSTVADALVNTRDVETALFEILANCLDVAGASRGAIFVREGDGRMLVRAQHGFTQVDQTLTKLLQYPGLLKQVEDAGTTVEVTSVIENSGIAQSLGTGALFVPLTAHGEFLGALLLDSPTGGASSEDWQAFGQAIGNQVSLALALARSFSRVEASEKRVRVLMESAEDAIFVGDAHGIIQEVNHAGERLLGRTETELVGKHFREIVPDPERALVDQEFELLLGSRPVRRADRHALRADGAKVPIEYSATMVTSGGERIFLAIVRDVSERNALAEQLRQAQKMEAIGRLAGGVAHDFNNMLSVVISYSDLLLREVASDDPMAADLSEIKKAGERAAEITRQLLALGRQQVIEARIISLNEVVASTEKMLRRLIGEDIELVCSLAHDLATIRADSGQMHQVLLNLAINARDAMPNGGTLTIQTKNVQMPAPTASLSGLDAGPYVMLSVIDSGMGIDEATSARIFEPFFTTKEAGKGTGLGLSTVFGIVKQSGGSIVVESEIDKGSKFHVYLPCAESKGVDTQAPSTPEQTTRGHETILLVEDEDQVRALIRGILRRRGYNVLEASNGGEAMQICEKHPSKIDLLLSDVVMPRMNGHDLAKRMRGLRPDMRVLLMSGYSDRAADAAAEFPLLSKPITPSLLATKLKEVLGRG